MTIQDSRIAFGPEALSRFNQLIEEVMVELIGDGVPAALVRSIETRTRLSQSCSALLATGGPIPRSSSSCSGHYATRFRPANTRPLQGGWPCPRAFHWVRMACALVTLASINPERLGENRLGRPSRSAEKRSGTKCLRGKLVL